MGSFLVGRGKKRDNRPVGLKDISLVGRATFCFILKLSFDLIRRYIVLYFLPKTPHLLPNKSKKMRFSRQPERRLFPLAGAYKSTVPTNLYTSVVDFIYFRQLVESSLYLVVGVGVLIIFGPSRPQCIILCENETRPARLKVKEKVLISGILQIQ